VGALTSGFELHAAKTAAAKKRMIFFMVTEFDLKLTMLAQRSKLEIFQIRSSK
jgi:hypothetical protein